MLHGGVLSGFVFIDADFDGARDDGEQGVPGVQISLSGGAVGAPVNLTALTQSDGSYAFNDLNPGTYAIGEKQPDPLLNGQAASASTGATVGDNQITTIALGDEQAIAGNNFGERGLRPEYVSLRLFLASTPAASTMLRETIASSEEAAGNVELAASIRAGETQPPVQSDPNDAPVAAADVYTVGEGGTLTVPAASGVLSNDTDADNDALTVQVVATATNGALTLSPDGSFTYTPTAGFNGTDTFTYRASDGELTSAVTTVTLNVEGVNDAPVAAADSYSIGKNGTLSIAAASGVLANDTDAENSPLSAQLVSNVADGTLTLNADGSFTYAPPSGFTGSVTFTYRASDGQLTSNAATVTITVTNTNQAPVAAANTYSTNENVTLTVNAGSGVLTNDTDGDGDSLTAQLVANVASGTLSLATDGSFTYAPNSNFSGADTFTYRASDGAATSNVVTVTITVVDAPANTLFGAVTTGPFNSSGLLGVRTDLVSGAPAITATHVDGDVDYTGYSNPPTYGNHHGFDPNGTDVNPGVTPRPTGVYTTEQPDEDLIHNLEHGHVWISYNPSFIGSGNLAALEQLILDGSPNANGGGVGVILTPRAANDAMISLASWARLLKLDSYDPATIRSFVETNRGKAPEGFITP
ncbi:MAG: Ig-like domain-containing protein [Pirellulales bacterium]